MIQLKQNNDIELSGFVLHKKGIEAVGEPSFKQWEKVGEFIRRSEESVHFWIGDWLLFGEKKYGETFSQAMDATKYNYQTLATDKWVSSRVPLSCRHENLSWDHHRAVAALEPEVQKEFLDQAEEKEMGREQLRQAVRQYNLKEDLPELSEEQRQRTDETVFQEVQACIDASVHAIEKLESLSWEKIHVDARDWLISHLKRAGTFYFGLVKQYDRQKRLSK